MADFGPKISIDANDIDDAFIEFFKSQLSDNPLRDIMNSVVKDALVHAMEFEGCSECGGETTVVCPDCRGSGETEIDCDECEGSGEQANGDECPGCAGTCIGAEDCEECEAEGGVMCYVCEGAGEVKREA
jgi:hypothetical protein